MALNLLTALVSAITGPTAAAHAGEVAEAARPRTDDCSTTSNDDKLTGKTDVHLCAPNPIVQTNSALVIPCTEAITRFATAHERLQAVTTAKTTPRCSNWESVSLCTVNTSHTTITLDERSRRSSATCDVAMDRWPRVAPRMHKRTPRCAYAFASGEVQLCGPSPFFNYCLRGPHTLDDRSYRCSATVDGATDGLPKTPPCTRECNSVDTRALWTHVQLCGPSSSLDYSLQEPRTPPLLLRGLRMSMAQTTLCRSCTTAARGAWHNRFSRR